MGSSSYQASFCVTAFRLRPVKEKRVRPKEILKVSDYRAITNPVPHFAPIPIMSTARARYSGPSPKFILALNIGTSLSGVAYAFLDPGQVPETRYVRWQALLQIPDPVIKGNE